MNVKCDTTVSFHILNYLLIPLMSSSRSTLHNLSSYKGVVQQPKVRYKVKYLCTRHEGVWGRWKYISTHAQPQHQVVGSDQFIALPSSPIEQEDGWASETVCLDFWRNKKNLFPCLKPECDCSVFHPVAILTTTNAIHAKIELSIAIFSHILQNFITSACSNFLWKLMFCFLYCNNGQLFPRHQLQTYYLTNQLLHSTEKIYITCLLSGSTVHAGAWPLSGSSRRASILRYFLSHLHIYCTLRVHSNEKLSSRTISQRTSSLLQLLISHSKGNTTSSELNTKPVAKHCPNLTYLHELC